MKILMVIPRLNPALGGGVNVVSNLSKFMARKGHEITIATTNFKFDIKHAKILEKEGVQIISFDYLFNFHLFIYSPKMIKWLSNNMKKYDIIHLNGARGYQNNVVYKYATKYNVPYVLQTHGSILRIVEISILKKIYDIVWGYNIYKNASKVIALTESEAKACSSMGINNDKIEVIPNGIDLSEFDDLTEKGKFRQKYFIKDGEKLILFLGRFHKSKGIELLIEAFSEIIKELDDAKLILAGFDDGYKDYLGKLSSNLKLAKNKVIFMDYISEKEKKMAFVDADVFVTPRFYGFPITYLEALACGTPIVTTNAGDYIKDFNGKFGYVVDFNSIDLKNAIVKILKDNALRNQYKRDALKKSKHFDWNCIVDDLLLLYNDCIE